MDPEGARGRVTFTGTTLAIGPRSGFNVMVFGLGYGQGNDLRNCAKGAPNVNSVGARVTIRGNIRVGSRIMGEG